MSHQLKILHVLRAPVGGLFRHVADLSRAQAAAGHQVGVVCCSEAGDRLTEERLGSLARALALGLTRVAMAREIDPRDITATRAIRSLANRLGVDVLHGHGAKGGAYARLAAAGLKRRGGHALAIYTPHGGSLHYAPTSLKGRVFMALERHLAAKTDAFIFESAYSSRIFDANVAPLSDLTWRVIPNGVGPDEFAPVETASAAQDFVFVGELRHLKGVDLLLEALAAITEPVAPRAVIVGDGPDAEAFKALAERLGLGDRVHFTGAMPARQAFALGRSLVMPSRAESFPYIVLEAGAAGLPLIATSVGGIPEIIAGTPVSLVEPGSVQALRAAMVGHLQDRAGALDHAAALRRAIGERFTIDAMAADIDALYTALGAAAH